MTGREIQQRMAEAVRIRAEVATRLLSAEAIPDEYLRAEAVVRAERRKLERFKLEAHVRFNGAQMTLADAEDLESAHATLSALGYRNASVGDGLRKVIVEGYRLPYDDDWT